MVDSLNIKTVYGKVENFIDLYRVFFDSTTVVDYWMRCNIKP